MLLPVLQADTNVTMTAKKLKELFEDHLKIIYPDKTFPEIKLEIVPTAPHQLSCLDNICQPAKHQHILYAQTPMIQPAFPKERKE